MDVSKYMTDSDTDKFVVILINNKFINITVVYFAFLLHNIYVKSQLVNFNFI